MLVQDIEIIDGRNFVHSYSDSGFVIRQVETGDEYEDALDPEEFHVEYIETDIPIDGDTSDMELLNIILYGGNE